MIELITFVPAEAPINPYDYQNLGYNGTDDVFHFLSEHQDVLIEKYLENYQKWQGDFMGPIRPEPILSEISSRQTIYPIVYKTIWENYKNQVKSHWVPEEIDFSKDPIDWKEKLSPNDRLFLMYILAFFASADSIVNCNIKQNVIDVVKIKESECAYGQQFAMENIHGEVYSIMLDVLIVDPVLKNKLLDATATLPALKKKAEWCKYWIDSDKTFAHKIVAFAIVEGIFFSGAFASIFWLKTRPGSVMPGLKTSNKFISRDEKQHVELAVAHFQLLVNRLKQEVVYEIFSRAIEIEIEFITDSLPCRLLGMNSDLMIEYIKYCGDRLLVQFGYEKLYNANNPFEFMKKIDGFIKNNFFEITNDDYSNSKVNNNTVLDWVVCDSF